MLHFIRPFIFLIIFDSLCIFYGGLNGIPPQFIKGHICQESDKIDFGGEVGIGFAPSYRYEPYTTQTWKGVLKDMETNPFYITATTNVNPPDHKYVKTIPYFKGDTITVWQIVAEHSQLLQDGSTDETRLPAFHGRATRACRHWSPKRPADPIGN